MQVDMSSFTHADIRLGFAVGRVGCVGQVGRVGQVGVGRWRTLTQQT